MGIDVLSLAIGFVVGTFTGAAGTYFGDKYTDQRRAKEAHRADQAIWREIEARFPAIIAEMRVDLSTTEFAHVREFFVKTSSTTVNVDAPCLEYHTDVHPELFSAVAWLEEIEYIQDITPVDCPKYRMRKILVRHLMED